MTAATPLYRSIMVEVERRRLQLGWPMWQLDDAAGTNDHHYSHCLYPDTPSGRQATWSTIDLFVQAMFPQGYDLEIRPRKADSLSAVKQRDKIRFAATFTNEKTLRERMREMAHKGGAKGGLARAAKLTKRQRQRIAKLGGKARWRKPRVVEVTGPEERNIREEN